MSRSIDFYLGLVTSEYAKSEKFQALLEVLLEKLNDVSDLADSIDAAFDLDLAVGVQLDILGEIVGQSRMVDFEIGAGRPFFGFDTADQYVDGFDAGNWESPTVIPPEITNNVLEDDDYRILLKAKVVKNHWSGKIADLEAPWADLFPDGRITILDEQDMSFAVAVTGVFPSCTVIDLIEHGYIVPRPQGVLANYYFPEDGIPWLGFDLQTDYIAGFDTGKWRGEKQVYPLFGFDLWTDQVAGFDLADWSR